ncbi:MAG: hypothetical protein M3Z75_27035, partial [Actinomycetota bacterium]|nr:hypothetical protein [Actinomycetota bacterium]
MVAMSENWPGNWYRGEDPAQPEVGAPGSPGARPRPSFTSHQESSVAGDKWDTGWGSATYESGGAGQHGAGQHGAGQRGPG